MPQYTHLDRCMIDTEAMLWIAVEVLSIHEYSGEFSERIGKLRGEAERLAMEMRRYNDQFETEQ